MTKGLFTKNGKMVTLRSFLKRNTDSKIFVLSSLYSWLTRNPDVRANIDTLVMFETPPYEFTELKEDPTDCDLEISLRNFYIDDPSVLTFLAFNALQS